MMEFSGGQRALNFPTTYFGFDSSRNPTWISPHGVPLNFMLAAATLQQGFVAYHKNEGGGFLCVSLVD